jgi:glucosamine-6-phosphate deaminase
MTRGQEINELLRLTADEMVERAQGRLVVVDTLDDLHRHLARDLADTITANNQANRPTVLIVPWGPVPQYPILVEIVNAEKISMKLCTFFFMDEYCDQTGHVVPVSHPESFRSAAADAWNGIQEDLRIPESQVIFPDHENILYLEHMMSNAGGIETCYGGIGIHGHVAFNEPEAGVAQTGPRCVDLNDFTTTINGIRSGVGGDLENFPSKAVTVGMRNILDARKIRLYCRNDIPGLQWANTVLRLAVFGEPGDDYPVTHVRSHPDWRVVTDRNTAEPAEHVLPVSDE